MKTFFSLVYPTKHRPEFVVMALKFLEAQNYDNFEVIISDNWSDPKLSCEDVCRNSSLKNIKYVRPSFPVGMVENWNHALGFARGDYVCYFTDKMFLLPGVLSYVNDLILSSKPDIVTWVDDVFVPDDASEFFGPGLYKHTIATTSKIDGYKYYNPLEELDKKASADKSRFENTVSEHARGKICYGAYSRALVDRILMKSGSLFKNIAPDYTSMILGLAFAESAIEINKAGIVHMSVNISNGQKTMVNDNDAFEFISQLECPSDILKNMLVPDLYSCQHNVVAHDYRTVRLHNDLNYNFNHLNWLVYIYEDFNIRNRNWSRPDIETQHKEIYYNYLNNQLDEQGRKYVELRISQRKRSKNKITLNWIKKIFRLVMPDSLFYRISGFIHGHRLVRLSRLELILIKSN
jgi:glycosyltransferase involved in cell wall biosynthesis